MSTRSLSVLRIRLLTPVVMVTAMLGLLPMSATAAETPIEVAKLLQEAFTSVAARAEPAVVVIANKQVVPQQSMQQLPPEFRRFFGIPEPQQPQPGERGPQRGERGPQRPRIAGMGSGVIIRENGYIVTNYHVIQDSTDLEVKLDNGRIFDSERDKQEVEVVGVDRETDLAVLRIGNGDLTGLPTLPFADSEKVRVGEWAIAVGAPFNLDYSVTVGHVSQIGRHDVGMTTFENYIQTDASINPGNSGGPLLNIDGEIIGINNFIVTGGGMSRGSVGIGFAISSNLVRQVADDIIEYGEVIRPFLGISMQPLDAKLRKQFGVDQGVLVNEVLAGNPAEKAGIKPGDVITHIGQKRVRTPNDLLFAVLAYDPGDEIRVQLIRKGEKETVQVTATRRGPSERISQDIRGRQDLLDKVGVSIEQDDDGLFVTGVVTGSPADRAGMRRGDRILEVNQTGVKTVEEVLNAMQNTRDNVVVFYIDRRGNKRYIGVELDMGNDDE